MRDDESIDSALMRFNKTCAKAGIIKEVRARSYYEKPSAERRRKRGLAVSRQKYRTQKQSY